MVIAMSNRPVAAVPDTSCNTFAEFKVVDYNPQRIENLSPRVADAIIAENEIRMALGGYKAPTEHDLDAMGL